ncbi:DNA repair protein rad2 [Recurvomyces mirabilis]|nr:DNA repair protein rad2 [Recurvomyces mirabilis]
MGVTGLWTIVQPCARPTKLETLNRKRLAVDASIWIYQFLKAVRDKEGNALRNSHVVGFFRRICKLLFFGIKPVFVFDGGAPALKRQTITSRKRRREGRRDDAVRTAGRMLAVQMQRRAEEDEERRKDARDRRAEEEEAVPDEGLVYVDELQMTQQERQENRKFRKKDAYHLPDMETGMHEMGGPNDPRVMSLEELEAYARQFDTGEDINVYDFSKIDYDSAFFMSLPASDRYNILNAARLRSRLRMGHSKEQLDSMFPDRMAFSRFQIDRVRERNELTTRLMNINDGDIKYTGAGNRVAGERAREYVLVKNDGVEGGYALCVISDEGTKRETAIDLDKPKTTAKQESSESEDDGFEDVPIEGLNRLPKVERGIDTAIGRQRKTGHASRRGGGMRRRVKQRPVPASAPQDDPDSLFVADEPNEDIEVDEELELVDEDGELFGEAEEPSSEAEDEDLRRAIAMSLDQNRASEAQKETVANDDDSEERDDWYQSFNQRAAEEARPVPKGSARAIANILNKRANAMAPESREVTSFGVPVPKPDDDVDAAVEDDDDDGMLDLQAALAESRQGRKKIRPPSAPGASTSPTTKTIPRRAPKATVSTTQPAETSDSNGFGGPLPFEKLNLGSSLLGKKKIQQRTEEAEGGFERAEAAEQASKKREPLPPWFSGDLEEGMAKQNALERADRERAKEFSKQFRFDGRNGEGLMGKGDVKEVIDLDADDDDVVADQLPPAKRVHGFRHEDVVELEDDGEEPIMIAPELTGKPVDNEIRMGDMADAVRVEPPVPDKREQSRPTARAQAPIVADDEGDEYNAQALTQMKRASVPFETADSDDDCGMIMNEQRATKSDTVPARSSEPEAEDNEEIAWSESGNEHELAVLESKKVVHPAGGTRVAADTTDSLPVDFEESAQPLASQRVDTESPAEPVRSPSPEFEDVDLSKRVPLHHDSPPPGLPFSDDEQEGPIPATGSARQETMPEDDGEFDDFSDPEEEELLKALTLEAEEHARFASTLNQKSAAQNIAEYEKELKQLRNQQKKDRRDADEVTHIMVTECQQLLRLFGLPYITAPMEAEAQCAELVHLGLVDGIVTDDSDCFLFGGTRVYKNMFNQAKFVECYLATDLEKEFDLTREKMIAIAQLLGSDYTEGLTGVGPVTALEILGEFPGGLPEFRDWWSAVQMQSIPKDVDKNNSFRKKFRKNATKMFLPPAFPDPRVEMAYKEPEVDSNPAAFQWGVPDLDALRSFLMATIGWTQERTDEVLVPVIRDMNRRADEGTQANITAFFDGGVGVGAAATNSKGEAFAPRKRDAGSKRMGAALGRMKERAKVQRTIGGSDEPPRVDMSVAGMNAGDETVENTGSKRKGKRSAATQLQERSGSASADDDSEPEAPRKRARRKGATGGKSSGATRGRRKKNAAVELDED